MKEEKNPKYKELAKWMKEEILSSRFSGGDKFYSELELSRKFQVNRQTVRHSFVLLEEQGFLIKKENTGMFVAYQPVNKSSTKTIGMISTYQESYIFPNIIKGIDQVLSDVGYRLQLALTQNRLENEGRYLTDMLYEGVDGIILEPTKSGLPNPNRELFMAIKNAGVPLVFFNANYPEIKAPYVSMDDYEVGRKATKYLIKKGHKRIATVMKSDDRQGLLRYSGYMETMILSGLGFNSQDLAWYSTEDIQYIEEDFQRIYRAIKDCSAIFCYNDQIAVKIINVLRSMNIIVPRDISVISVDNSDFAEKTYVGITSIPHPMEDLGRAVAEKIIHLINDPQDVSDTKFKPMIIERDSAIDRRE